MLFTHFQIRYDHVFRDKAALLFKMSQLDTRHPEFTPTTPLTVNMQSKDPGLPARQRPASPGLSPDYPGDPEPRWPEMRFHTAEVNQKLTAWENSVPAIPYRELQI